MEWPFGAGLSYTQFRYSDLDVTVPAIVNEASTINVSLSVENIGNQYSASHTVMLFVSHMYRSVTPESKLLKRFTKVDLDAGQSKRLSWLLNVADDLRFVGLNSR